MSKVAMVVYKKPPVESEFFDFRVSDERPQRELILISNVEEQDEDTNPFEMLASGYGFFYENVPGIGVMLSRVNVITTYAECVYKFTVLPQKIVLEVISAEDCKTVSYSWILKNPERPHGFMSRMKIVDNCGTERIYKVGDRRHFEKLIRREGGAFNLYLVQVGLSHSCPEIDFFNPNWINLTEAIFARPQELNDMLFAHVTCELYP